MRRARLIPLLILFAEPAVARAKAQARLTGEAGYSRIEQPELAPSGAATAGLTFDYARQHSLIHTSILGARSGDGRQTGQWVSIGSLLSPSWKSWAVQGTGVFSAFGQTTLSATTSRDLLVQARTGNARRGFSIGGGLGTTVHNAVAIPNRHGQADAWLGVGRERINVDAGLTRTRSVFGGSSILVDISRRNVNYADLSVGWTHDAGAWSVGAAAGARGRNGTFGNGNEWQSIDATAWLTRNLGVALSAGRTLEDLVRGVPRTKYFSIGLRLESQPHLSLLTSRRRPAGPRVVASRVGDVRRIEISNVVAERVELMADFTEWNPVALAASGQNWRLERAIAPGPHRLTIRVDGGEWIVPANLPRVDDELMGTVGLITVP
jgi:hypothetical protein